MIEVLIILYAITFLSLSYWQYKQYEKMRQKDIARMVIQTGLRRIIHVGAGNIGMITAKEANERLNVLVRADQKYKESE